jgi:hypothetical protein
MAMGIYVELAEGSRARVIAASETSYQTSPAQSWAQSSSCSGNSFRNIATARETRAAANYALHRTWSRALQRPECGTISRAAPSR